MSTDKKFPLLKDVIGASVKTAANVSDPGPDSGHPASVGDDNLPVSEGDTITDAKKKNEAARGGLAADSVTAPVTDKPAFSIGTETGKDGDELSGELEVNDGISDPGPESGHPASVPTEKFASCETAADVAAVIETELKKLAELFADEGRKQAGHDGDPGKGGSPKRDPKLKNSDEVGESDDEPTVPLHNKIAGLIDEMLDQTPDASGVSMRQRMDHSLASQLEPYVAEGVRRGENLAQFIKIAAADPEAAAMMMSEDPMAGGGGDIPPELMGGDPMGGDPMGGAGGGGPTGDPEIDNALAEVAQLMGTDPATVLELLMEGDAGGGMEGGGDPMGGEGGGLPPELAGGDGAGDAGGEMPIAPEEEPAEEPAPEEEPAEESKEAGIQAQRAKDTVRRKIAEALLSETGKTPKQLATR